MTPLNLKILNRRKFILWILNVQLRLIWGLFVLRFFTNKIALNKFLCKIGIKDFPMCAFCQSALETMIHIFCDCEKNFTLILKSYRSLITIKHNDMLFYSPTTMMFFLTKEWYGFPAYTVNLFIKAYQRITYKEDLKIAWKRRGLEMISFSLWF